tara:strand:+ start:463 stop:1218 length:756 start_codon:yes stop_codon:yes gene_type:complete
MLKKRVLPSLLFKENSLVKGKKFNSSRKVGSVMEAIKTYDLREVDELFFFDVSASLENRTVDHNYINDISKECFVPLCVGGGVNSIESISNLLKSGADKVCVNSKAISDLSFLEKASKKFGSQCIVVSIDYRAHDDFQYVYSKSGSLKSEIDLFDHILSVEKAGAGEIILTSIEHEGTMQGYDYDILKKAKTLTNIPLIANGGAGGYEDMLKAFNYSGVDAVCASSIYHFTEKTPKEAKSFLKNKGINVRI